ncbi:MAG: rhomboid family intramembrane serine protease [Acidobacteriota bacterium]
MSYRFERYDPMSRIRGASAVKVLIIVNVAIFILQKILQLSHLLEPFDHLFGLVPELITTKFYLWQFATSMFLHGGLWHILMNMLGLFFFGPELEWLWGKRRFLLFYFGIGMLASLFAYLLNIHSVIPTIGASGAVFGVISAYAMLYPDRQIIVYIFPMKVKYFVIFFFIFSFLGTLGLEGDVGTSHASHLAGIIFGALYIKLSRLRAFDQLRDNFKEKLRLWRLRRKYRNFRVVDRDVKKMWDDLEDRINDDKRNSRIN